MYFDGSLVTHGYRGVMQICIVCGERDGRYKCSRCQLARYCSVACCKNHFEQCEIPAVVPSNTEEGEIEPVQSRFRVLKGDVQIREYLEQNSVLIRQLVTAPDPILAVQRQRKSNKWFNDVAVKILSLL